MVLADGLLASALEVNIVRAFMAGIVLGTMPADDFENAKEQISSSGSAAHSHLFCDIGFRIDLPNAFDAQLFFDFCFSLPRSRAFASI